MSLHKYELGFLLIILNIYSLELIDAVNVTASDSAANPLQAPTYQSHGSSAVVSSPVYKPAVDSSFSVNLLSSFPEDLEISEYCTEVLRLFSQRYVAYVNCLIPAARPVRVCQNCSPGYSSLSEVFLNISSDQLGPGNVSCRDSILRSDQLMLVFLLYGNLDTIWLKSNCKRSVQVFKLHTPYKHVTQIVMTGISNCPHSWTGIKFNDCYWIRYECVTTDLKGPNNDTLYYLTLLNQTITCFEKYKEGNHTELCKNCKNTYKGLNDLYSGMEKNSTLCVDLEDSMNMTRKLWSKNFACSFPREETIPVIAVSSFMLFLPIIFYLSSFLHSEQKKRKLIHPKRAKSHNSLMNIQDKQS